MEQKYLIQSPPYTVEFASYTDAEVYANINGIPTSSIESSSYSTASLSNDDIFLSKIKEGYNIPNTPYFLGLDNSDRLQFSGMLDLLNEAIQYGYMTTESMTMIRDKNYNEIPITVGGFKQLMISYGLYYKTIWDVREDPSEYIE